MDTWILSFTNSLVSFVRKEMSEYHLYSVVSPLTKYFDTLTNVYIRLNRPRFKGALSEEEETEESNVTEEDRLKAMSTLGHVLVLITRLMAPFTPFFCDYLWDNLKNVVSYFLLLPKFFKRFF